MAAAEVRAAWQRTANRRFVQEDATRASKLSSCASSSSSSSSSGPQFDGKTNDPPNPSEYPISGCKPHNLNADQPPVMKWWLHLQPSFGHCKNFTHEQLNFIEAELEVMCTDVLADPTFKSSMNHKSVGDTTTTTTTTNYNDAKCDHDSLLDQPSSVSATYMKSCQDARIPELRASLFDNPQMIPKSKEMSDFWYPDEHLMGLDPFENPVSKQPKKHSSDIEPHLPGSGEIKPWWRRADKDELVSLVAQKSLEHIENCDLPRPQAKLFSWEPSSSIDSSEFNETLRSSFDGRFSSLTSCIQGSPPSGCTKCNSGDASQPPHGYEGAFRETSKNQGATPDDGPTKSQLLEALCHSQTRARKAEKAAQQAYEEREHVITLFIKQASELFAYRQWLHLLQLENLCLQLKNQNHPIPDLFPRVLSWLPQAGKRRHKAAKRKRGAAGFETAKCAIVIAVGLSLAGAGLLLGWTMGWLFPSL